MEYNSILPTGTLLCNNTYRIEKVLGHGGFGITYLARHTVLNKLVAIKEYFPNTFCKRDATTGTVTSTTEMHSELVEKLKQKFIKEAVHIAKFDSPNIVKIIDVFEENGTAYYIMDYIDGMSLSEYVKANGPLSEKQAIEYIIKVGNALIYIHSMRINHLDVKPANIMLRKTDNNPILVDFGLSKQYDSNGNQTSTTPVGISHGFAPMEQYTDGGVKEFSPQTDLYSLAATLYYLLSGIVPPQSTLLIDDELTFPSTISPRLVAPITKAMSAARKNRQTTIGEFLNQIQGKSGIQGMPTEETKIITEDTELDTTGHTLNVNSSKKETESITGSSKDLTSTANNGIKKKESYQTFYIIGGVVILIVVGILLIPKGGTGAVPDNDSDTPIAADSQLAVEDDLGNVPKPEEGVGPSYLPFNPDGCPYVYVEGRNREDMAMNKSVTANIYCREYTFTIGDDHPNATLAIVNTNEYSYNLFRDIDFGQDHEWYFDEFDTLNEDCSMQITAMDFNNDGECELLLTFKSEDNLIEKTFVFKLLPQPYKDSIVKYLGEIDGQEHMHVEGTSIIAPYGSFGDYTEYILSTDNRVIEISD